MSNFLIWYLSGALGTCIISHFDNKRIEASLKEENTYTLTVTRDFHEYLLFSLLGGVMLVSGLWIMYGELTGKYGEIK